MDPRKAGPQPPFPKQQQKHPGSIYQLDPAADHGESTYRGAAKLQGRAAIVTGGDSGIGRAVSIAFAKEGADLVVSYLPEEQEDAQATAKLIEALGRKVILLPGDIGSSSYAQTLVDACMETFSRLDIVVNNAAYQMTREDITDISDEEFEHTFRTNVFGLFYLTRSALPHMKPGGVILNTTSIQAYEPSENLFPYASTKAAIANATKSLAKLAGKQGVRVNAVAPGPVWTPLIPSTMDEEKVRTFGQNTVFERPAQPVEIARVFVFLASDDASFASGEVYGATGGRTPF